MQFEKAHSSEEEEGGGVAPRQNSKELLLICMLEYGIDILIFAKKKVIFIIKRSLRTL